MGWRLMARLLGTWPDNSPEWHEARRWRIGGSEVGAICGLSPYETRDGLLEHKLSGTVTPPTEAMKRGHWAEPYLRAMLADRGIIGRGEGGTWVADEADWALANPDDVSLDDELLEYKCHRTRDGYGRGGTNQIPAHELAQVTWYCGILGLDRWVLAVHATKPDGFDDAVYRGRFDPDLYRLLTRKAADFMADLNDARKALRL